MIQREREGGRERDGVIQRERERKGEQEGRERDEESDKK